MIGIISDTHDNQKAAERAMQIFKEKKVDFIVHLGDLCAPIMPNFFKDIKTRYILGNIDNEHIKLKENIEKSGGEFLGLFATTEIAGKKIAMYHGTILPLLDALIKSQEFDYVLHGHTHNKRDEKIGKTRVLNPGCHAFSDDNFVIIFDPGNDKAEFVEVNFLK